MIATLSRRAFLGAELPGDAEAFTADGVRIAGVFAGGMAARAGLAGGDLLVSLAGLPVRDLCELAAALRAAGAAPSAELAFVRDGIRRTATVDVAVQPRESDVDYGELAAGGARLRTLATRVASPRAVVLVIQGIACESIDHGVESGAPLAALVDDWTRAGYVTLRFDKRGIGDSEGGPCRDIDFATELADARAMLAFAAVHARDLGVPLVVFGHSVGGIIAALIANDVPLAGIAAYGTPVMQWIECLVDSARNQLALRGASQADVTARIAAIHRLAETGELNGRSAAYHAQLQTVDIAAAWRAVDVPVLVVRGEHDWVVAADEQARIATLARGPTEVVDVAGLDHLFGHHASREASLRDYGIGAYGPQLGTATIAWLDRLRSST